MSVGGYVAIEREVLELALDCLHDCKTQNEGEEYDFENERCIPDHKWECGRCYAKRKIEEALGLLP